MHIEHSHNVGATEAARRINALLDDLLRRPLPAGVIIKDVSRNWSGNTLDLSVHVKKGFWGTTLAGALRVNDNLLALDCDLPGLIATFVPEDKIRDAIRAQLDMLFPP